MEGLTPGRIVHYVLANEDQTWMTGAHRAAIVVRTLGEESTEQGFVDLHVFTVPQEGPEQQTTVMHKSRVPFDPEGAQGTWHWIEHA